MNQENKERRFTFIIGLLGPLMDHFLHIIVFEPPKVMHCRYTPEYKRFTCSS